MALSFTEFQKAVLDRVVRRDGKRMFVPDALTESVSVQTAMAKEEKEVKMNMRFLSK